MKQTDIESFLRDSRPHVKDNPTFLLEVRQKMHEVDGIKSEIDTQRRLGHITLLLALMIGLIAGIATVLFIYLSPGDSNDIGNELITSIRTFIEHWKEYLILAIVAGITASGLALSHLIRHAV